MEEPPGLGARRALIDLLVLMAVCTSVIVVTARLQPLQDLVNRNQSATGTADAIIAAVVVIPIALALFARRRYQMCIRDRNRCAPSM